jgi:hypothetical protein
MSTATTSAGSLREPFESKVAEIEGVEIVAKAAYSRAVLGKRTLAYIGGDRKLRVEVRAEAGSLPKAVGEFKPLDLATFTVASEADFERVVLAIRSALPSEETPAEALAEKAAETAKAAEVEPDPKPAAKKSRSRKAKATA